MSSPDAGLFDSPLWSRITSSAAADPKRICITETGGASIAYGEFRERIDAAACALTARGVVRGDRVLFLARPTIDSVVCLIAILRAGGVAVLADPAMGREAFRSRIRSAGISFVVLEPALFLISRLPLLERLLRAFGAEIPDMGGAAGTRRLAVRSFAGARGPAAPDARKLGEDDDALIVFTSGTTTVPKGVVHTYGSILATLDLVRDELSPKRDDVFYASQSYFLLIALLCGATAILPRARAFSPGAFLRNMTAYRATKAFLLPAEGEELISHCRAAGETLPSSLRTLMLGSAPVLKGFLQRLKSILASGTEVLSVYGATEILPMARISMEEKLAYVGEGDVLGTPFPQVAVRIQDGEIAAKGANLARSYLDGEPLQEYLTGDIGIIDERGRIVLLGRKKDMIIKGNYNVYPTLFESSISTIPGVKRCALLGVYREEKSDEEIVLVIEPESEEAQKKLESTVRAELRSGPRSIDAYAQPDRIIFMDIPLGGRSRKPDKAALRERIRRLA